MTNKNNLWIIIGLLVLAGLWAAYFFFKKDTAPKTPETINNIGKRVYVNYVWTFEDWSVFDTSIKEVAQEKGLYKEQDDMGGKYQPLQFIVGAGQMIPWFDRAVIDMKVWDKKKITLKPADAYGEYNTGLVTTMPRSQFQEANIVPKVGDEYNSPNGVFTVLEMTTETVTVDYNSKMAGKVLVFDISLERIDEPQAPINESDRTIEIEATLDDVESSNLDKDGVNQPESNPDQIDNNDPASTPQPTGQE